MILIVVTLIGFIATWLHFTGEIKSTNNKIEGFKTTLEVQQTYINETLGDQPGVVPLP